MFYKINFIKNESRGYMLLIASKQFTTMPPRHQLTIINKLANPYKNYFFVKTNKENKSKNLSNSVKLLTLKCKANQQTNPKRLLFYEKIEKETLCPQVGRIEALGVENLIFRSRDKFEYDFKCLFIFYKHKAKDHLDGICPKGQLCTGNNDAIFSKMETILLAFISTAESSFFEKVDERNKNVLSVLFKVLASTFNIFAYEYEVTLTKLG